MRNSDARDTSPGCLQHTPLYAAEQSHRQVHGLDWEPNPWPFPTQADAVSAEPHLPGPLLYDFSPPSKKGDS